MSERPDRLREIDRFIAGSSLGIEDVRTIRGQYADLERAASWRREAEEVMRECRSVLRRLDCRGMEDEYVDEICDAMAGIDDLIGEEPGEQRKEEQ